ncbi:sigma-70 family RNA polymerase sigma factor [soil metagenome]
MTEPTTPDPATALAAAFESHRTHLRAVAYRMLGSVHEADDAVQEAWLRLARSDATAIDNLGGWLTTTVSRLCLDHLRTRGSRREAPLPDHEDVDVAEVAPGPEAEVLLADRVGDALQVVLAALSPAERLAFVLHDLFAVPFEEIGSVLGRSPAAVRQLASRGRRRVQSEDPATDQALDRADGPDPAMQRRVVTAFLAASTSGDFQGLLDVLDPGAVVRSDGAAAQLGSPALTEGASAVATFFDGRARAARLVTIDGYAGAAWSLQGEVKVAFAFTLAAPSDPADEARIIEIELLGDPEVLASLDVGHLPQPRG